MGASCLENVAISAPKRQLAASHNEYKFVSSGCWFLCNNPYSSWLINPSKFLAQWFLKQNKGMDWFWGIVAITVSKEEAQMCQKGCVEIL